MAVYTPVSHDELKDFLAQYSQGELVTFAEIGDGIENSNYFVTLNNPRKAAKQQRWVLTLFENLSTTQLPFFLHLMNWLADKGFPVPAPCPRKDGAMNGELKGKPAILVPCFNGRSIDRPTAEHCRQVGRFVADMHQALEHCPQTRQPPRDIGWMREKETSLATRLPSSELKWVSRAIDHYQTMKPEMDQCPQGLVHADLFRDNVLFDGDSISGVIDFFHACTDSLMFDVAVIANDWTADSHGQHETAKLNALVEGYSSVREITDSERLLLPDFMHLAALRFWLSRLESRYLPGYQQQSTEGDKTKDPDELKRIIMSLGRMC